MEAETRVEVETLAEEQMHTQKVDFLKLIRQLVSRLVSAEGESGLTVDEAGAELVTQQLNKMHAAMFKSTEIKTIAWWWTEQLGSGKRHGRGRDTAVISLPFGAHERVVGHFPRTIRVPGERRRLQRAVAVVLKDSIDATGRLQAKLPRCVRRGVPGAGFAGPAAEAGAEVREAAVVA